MTRYAFIDGHAFSEFVKSSIERLNLDPPAEFSFKRYIKWLGGYHRVFYYDAYPVKKREETEEEFKSRYDSKEDYFSKLNRLDCVHVRTGTARHRNKKQGGLQQKGVDIQLALDAYQHAVRDNMNTAVIYASDLDFYPLLEALTQTRATSELRYELGKTSDMLVEAADAASALSLRDFAFGCHNYGLLNSNTFGNISSLRLVSSHVYLEGNIQIYDDGTSYLVQYDKSAEYVAGIHPLVGIDYIEHKYKVRMSPEGIENALKNIRKPKANPTENL